MASRTPAPRVSSPACSTSRAPPPVPAPLLFAVLCFDSYRRRRRRLPGWYANLDTAAGVGHAVPGIVGLTVAFDPAVPGDTSGLPPRTATSPNLRSLPAARTHARRATRSPARRFPVRAQAGSWAARTALHLPAGVPGAVPSASAVGAFCWARGGGARIVIIGSRWIRSSGASSLSFGIPAYGSKCLLSPAACPRIHSCSSDA